MPPAYHSMVHPAAWRWKKEAVTSCWAGRVPDWLQFLKSNSEMGKFRLFLSPARLPELKRMYFTPWKRARETFRAGRGVNNWRWLELRVWANAEEAQRAADHNYSTCLQNRAIALWLSLSPRLEICCSSESSPHLRARARCLWTNPSVSGAFDWSPRTSAVRWWRSPLLRRPCVTRMERSALWHVSCLRCLSTTHFLPARRCVNVRVSPKRLPLRGIAMKDPRVPPMTLCGRRRGGFLKEPVYWCRKECMLWEVGGRPFLMKGSEKRRGGDLVRRVRPISTFSTACSGILFLNSAVWSGCV